MGDLCENIKLCIFALAQQLRFFDSESVCNYSNSNISVLSIMKITSSFLVFLNDSLLFIVFFRRQIYNGLWPTTWDNLLAALAVVFMIMYVDHPKVNMVSYYFWLLGDFLYIDDSYPYLFRLFMISLISSVIYFIVMLYTRQYLLRILLAYKGWLCKFFCYYILFLIN